MDTAAPDGGAVVSSIPAEGWPSLRTIEYLTKLILLGLLLLALPYIVGRLIFSPGEVMEMAAGRAMKVQ